MLTLGFNRWGQMLLHFGTSKDFNTSAAVDPHPIFRPPPSTPAATRYHPSRTHARSPTLEPRNPKKAAQKASRQTSWSSEPPASPSGGGRFAINTVGGLSCDRRPNCCESGPKTNGSAACATSLAIVQPALVVYLLLRQRHLTRSDAKGTGADGRRPQHAP